MTRAGAADAGRGSPPTLHDALGLAPGTAPDEVEETRRRLEAYLAAAPDELRAWAGRQAAVLDAHDAGTAADDALGAPADAADPIADPDDAHDPTEEDDDDPSGRDVPRAPRPRWVRALVAVLGVLAVAGVVVGVYHLGADEPPAQDAASWNPPTAGSAMPQVDAERVADLEGRLAEDPEDVATLTELADLHFAAGEYLGAARWQREIVELDPQDTDARLVLGVALFNSGDLDGAEEQWLTVTELDPELAEAYYDLGFLYISRQPADVAAAEAAWEKVIELAPDSDLARVVATHIDGLEDMVGGTGGG